MGISYTASGLRGCDLNVHLDHFKWAATEWLKLKKTSIHKGRWSPWLLRISIYLELSASQFISRLHLQSSSRFESRWIRVCRKHYRPALIADHYWCALPAAFWLENGSFIMQSFLIEFDLKISETLFKFSKCWNNSICLDSHCSPTRTPVVSANRGLWPVYIEIEKKVLKFLKKSLFLFCPS